MKTNTMLDKYPKAMDYNLVGKRHVVHSEQLGRDTITLGYAWTNSIGEICVNVEGLASAVPFNKLKFVEVTA